MYQVDPLSYNDCLNSALRILQRAAQTEFKMREKLSKRGFEPEIVAKVLARLKELRLIDDQKYAADYVAYRSRTSPLGPQYLRVKLLQKGIVNEMAANASAMDPESELELANILAQKKLKLLHSTSPPERSIKLARYLISRGFRQATVYQVINSISF